jgi:hypothetical protein
MPFPAGLTLVTVTCQLDAPPDGGGAGRVRFEAPYPLLGPIDGSIVPPFTVAAEIAEDGSATVELPANDDPQWTPVGWAYNVTVSPAAGPAFRGTAQFTYASATADLSDVFQPDGATEQGVTYATLAQLQALADDAVELPIEIEDVNDLQTQLDSKQVAGTYLDISTAPTAGTWAVGDIVDTQVGRFRCSVAGTPGTWVPMWREQALDKGYVAWNGDPGQSVQAGTIVPTGGLSFIFRLRALGPLITKVQMHCSTTASGITNAWCTLHDDSGLILNANAKSDANQNTAFNSGGMKNFTFVAPQVVTPGAFYRARVWFTTGGTLPTISRMCNSNTAIINPDITGTAASTAYGWASADGSLTDLASAPDQIGNLTGIGTAWWMGAK